MTGACRGGSFLLAERELDVASGAAVFRYELDGDGFEEVVHVPGGGAVDDPAALDLLLDLCHVAMGTSYFKLSAPKRLRFKRPTAPAGNRAGASSLRRRAARIRRHQRARGAAHDRHRRGGRRAAPGTGPPRRTRAHTDRRRQRLRGDARDRAAGDGLGGRGDGSSRAAGGRSGRRPRARRTHPRPTARATHGDRHERPHPCNCHQLQPERAGRGVARLRLRRDGQRALRQ